MRDAWRKNIFPREVSWCERPEANYEPVKYVERSEECTRPKSNFGDLFQAEPHPHTYTDGNSMTPNITNVIQPIINSIHIEQITTNVVMATDSIFLLIVHLHYFELTAGVDVNLVDEGYHFLNEG